jgi:hypothetical protein
MLALRCSRQKLLWVFGGVLLGALGVGVGLYVLQLPSEFVGSYPTVEVRMTFLDRRGNPVEGVELRVVDEVGQVSWGYPVTDFLPSKPLRSDKQGNLTFHHVSQGVEYSAQMSILDYFLGYSHLVPRFNCCLILEDRAILNVDFRTLIREGKTTGMVERKWDPCQYIEDLAIKSRHAPKEQWFAFLDESKRDARNASQKARYYYIVNTMGDCWICLDQGRDAGQVIRYQVIEYPVVLSLVNHTTDE